MTKKSVVTSRARTKPRVVPSLETVEVPLVVPSTRPLDRACALPPAGAGMDAIHAVVDAVAHELQISSGDAGALVAEYALDEAWRDPRGAYRKVMRRVGPRRLASVKQTLSPDHLDATVYLVTHMPREGQRLTLAAKRRGTVPWMQRALRLAFRGELTTNVTTGAANENGGEL